MRQRTVCLGSGDKEKEVMPDVVLARFQGKQSLLVNILGEQKTLSQKMRGFDLSQYEDRACEART